MSQPSRGPGLPDAPLIVADSLVGYLAVWQLMALAAVYGGLSFSVLFPAGFVAFLGLALPAFTRPWQGAASDGPPPTPPSWAIGIALLLALAGWAGFGGGLLGVPVVAFVAAPLAWLYVGPRSPVGGQQAPRAGPIDLAVIVGVGIVAAFITLKLRRADVDDAYYLNAVMQTLLHPALPALGFDGIHGDTTAPIQQVIHRPQTWELLVAWWARLLGLEARFAYWLVAPAAVATTIGLVHWSFLKRLAPRLAPLAVIAALGVAWCWGDGLTPIGRFGFPRLFQGKSVFVTCAMPLLAAALLAHAQAPSRRTWLRLLAAAFGATAFTSTALVVVPLALAFGGLGGLRRDKESAAGVLTAWATVVPVLVVLGMLWLEMQAAGGLVSDGHELPATAALGRIRSGMVLVALAALPWLLRGQGGAVWVARVVGPALLLLLNGLVPGWIGDRAAQLLNWRTFWAIPFTPLLGLVVAAGLAAGWRLVGERAPADGARLLFGAAFAVAFVWRGPWAVQGDGIGYRFAAEKTLDRYERVADTVLSHAGPDDMVAASPLVSQALAMRENKPRLNGVWIRYVVNLTRHWGAEETERRLKVLNYVRGHAVQVPTEALDAQCVTVVVLSPRNRGRGDSATTLPELGFRKVAARDAHMIWQRSPQGLPGSCQPTDARE